MTAPDFSDLSDEDLVMAEAELGRNDFYYFVNDILRVGEGSDIVRPRTEIEPVCQWLQRDRPDWVPHNSRWKRFMALPRGTAKTTLVKSYVAWRIIRNPNIRVYYTSEEKALSLDITESVAEMLASDRVEALYGLFKGETGWQRGKYTVTQRTKRGLVDPTLMAGGVDVSAQGRHPEIIIADDLQGLTNRNPEGIEKVKQYLRLLWPVLNPGGELIWICTRWDYADAAASILAEAEANPNAWDIPVGRGYFGAYAKEGDEEFFPHAVVGEPLFPSILDRDELRRLRDPLVMNIYDFSCQYLNDPIPSEAAYFRPEDFQPVEEYDATNPTFQGLTFYMGVDPATGIGHVSRGDDTAIVVIGVKGSRTASRQVYVVEVAGGRWKPSEAISRIFALYEKWRPRRVALETAGVGKMFYAQLQEHMRAELLYLPIKEVQHAGTKESKGDRIGRLEPLYHAHQIFHVGHLAGGVLEEQLLRFKPGGAVHDDYPDALAMAMEVVREGHMRRRPATKPSYVPRYPDSTGY